SFVFCFASFAPSTIFYHHSLHDALPISTFAPLALPAQTIEDVSVLELTAVPVPLNSYRLLAMTRDEDGFIWTGSIHRTIHRYDPDRKSTRLNSSHVKISYAVFCLKKKKI